MAPKSKRRTGYSRKAQYSNFLGYVAGVAGLLLGLAVLLGSLSNHAGFAWARSAASDIAVPAGRLAAGTRRTPNTRLPRALTRTDVTTSTCSSSTAAPVATGPAPNAVDSEAVAGPA